MDAFSSSKGDLGAEEDVATSMVNPNESPGEFLGVVLATSRMWETTLRATDEVIDGDAIAGAEVVLAKCHLL